jgi:hypothetical protein
MRSLSRHRESLGFDMHRANLLMINEATLCSEKPPLAAPVEICADDNARLIMRNKCEDPFSSTGASALAYWIKQPTQPAANDSCRPLASKDSRNLGAILQC